MPIVTNELEKLAEQVKRSHAIRASIKGMRSEVLCKVWRLEKHRMKAAATKSKLTGQWDANAASYHHIKDELAERGLPHD